MESNVKFWRLVFQDDFDYLEQEHVAATEKDIQDIAFRFFSCVAFDRWGDSPVDNYPEYISHTKTFYKEVSPEQYRASL